MLVFHQIKDERECILIATSMLKEASPRTETGDSNARCSDRNRLSAAGSRNLYALTPDLLMYNNLNEREMYQHCFVK